MKDELSDSNVGSVGNAIANVHFKIARKNCMHMDLVTILWKLGAAFLSDHKEGVKINSS